MSRRSRREKRKLVGFYNEGTSVGFILPLFEAGRAFAMQRRDEEDRVREFVSLEHADIEPDEVFHSDQSIEVTVGDPALHAFQAGKNDVIVGSRADVAETLRRRIADFSECRNLLMEIASFIGTAEQQRTRRVSSRHDARKGLSELRKFRRRLKQRTTVRTHDAAPLLSEFTDYLPSAIDDVLRTQRRSMIDVLLDMTWAVEHNIQDIQELAYEQETAGVEGDLRELWIVARHILDLRKDFYPAVRKNLLSEVHHTYFIPDTLQFKKLSDKIEDDIGKDYLEYISGVHVSGSHSEFIFMNEFALWNPEDKETIGGKALVRGSEIRFIRLGRQQALSLSGILRSIKNQALVAKGKIVELGTLSIHAKVITADYQHGRAKKRV